MSAQEDSWPWIWFEVLFFPSPNQFSLRPLPTEWSFCISMLGNVISCLLVQGYKYFCLYKYRVLAAQCLTCLWSPISYLLLHSFCSNAIIGCPGLVYLGITSKDKEFLRMSRLETVPGKASRRALEVGQKRKIQQGWEIEKSPTQHSFGLFLQGRWEVPHWPGSWANWCPHSHQRSERLLQNVHPRTPRLLGLSGKVNLEVWRHTDRKATAAPGRASTPKTGDSRVDRSRVPMAPDPAFCPWNSPWGRLEASPRSAHSGPLCSLALCTAVFFSQREPLHVISFTSSSLPCGGGGLWLNEVPKVSSFILLSTSYNQSWFADSFVCLFAGFLSVPLTPPSKVFTLP